MINKCIKRKETKRRPILLTDDKSCSNALICKYKCIVILYPHTHKHRHTFMPGDTNTGWLASGGLISNPVINKSMAAEGGIERGTDVHDIQFSQNKGDIHNY